MTDMQAALGASQVNRLEEFIKKRHGIRESYEELFKKIPITLPYQDPEGHSALHLYPVCVEHKDDKEIFSYLRENGVGVNVHYIPIHTQPYYQEMGLKRGAFPIAEDYYERAISLPMYPDLEKSEIEYIRNILSQALQNVMV